MSRGNLTGAQLAGTNLVLANLTSANFYRATLTDANLASANLTDTRLDGAILTDAWLARANPTTAKNLTQQQLDSARGNEKTQLPAGLQRPAHGSAGSAAPPAADP